MICRTKIDWSQIDDTLDPPALARAARLRYVSDDEPGFSRRKHQRGFTFIDANGRAVRQSRALQRIQSLVIPPAWRDVWICRFEDGHLQVTGRDEQQRKQYIYHERWRETSNLAKFRRIFRFGTLLPELRKHVQRELRQRKHNQDKVCALVLALLDQTSLRVGNEEYVKANRSYGLTTLRRKHVVLENGDVCLKFRGKSGVPRCILVQDPRLAKLVLRCRDLPGAHLFTYAKEDGGYDCVNSDDVNRHLRALMDESFTAKDFRTWKASAWAAGRLMENNDLTSRSQRNRFVSQVVKQTAEVLGNTPSVCRQFYVHPALLESFIEGEFSRYVARYRARRRRWISGDEQVLLHFLRVSEDRALSSP
jgi:DNA topoisomerase-1